MASPLTFEVVPSDSFKQAPRKRRQSAYEASGLVEQFLRMPAGSVLRVPVKPGSSPESARNRLYAALRECLAGRDPALVERYSIKIMKSEDGKSLGVSKVDRAKAAPAPAPTKGRPSSKKAAKKAK